MLWQRFKNWFRGLFNLEPVFLCDSCRYDYGNACKRRERPNALECPDYQKKGESGR
jgi:hypothetical protein